MTFCQDRRYVFVKVDVVVFKRLLISHFFLPFLARSVLLIARFFCSSALTKSPSKSKAMKAIESQVSVRFLTVHQLFIESQFSSTMSLYSL